MCVWIWVNHRNVQKYTNSYLLHLNHFQVSELQFFEDLVILGVNIKRRQLYNFHRKIFCILEKSTKIDWAYRIFLEKSVALRQYFIYESKLSSFLKRFILYYSRWHRAQWLHGQLGARPRQVHHPTQRGHRRDHPPPGINFATNLLATILKKFDSFTLLKK